MSRRLAGLLDRPASTGASESGGQGGSCVGRGDDTDLLLPSSPAERARETAHISEADGVGSFVEEIALCKRSQSTEGLLK